MFVRACCCCCCCCGGGGFTTLFWHVRQENNVAQRLQSVWGSRQVERYKLAFRDGLLNCKPYFCWRSAFAAKDVGHGDFLHSLKIAQIFEPCVFKLIRECCSVVVVRAPGQSMTITVQGEGEPRGERERSRCSSKVQFGYKIEAVLPNEGALVLLSLRTVTFSRV